MVVTEAPPSEGEMAGVEVAGWGERRSRGEDNSGHFSGENKSESLSMCTIPTHSDVMRQPYFQCVSLPKLLLGEIRCICLNT